MVATVIDGGQFSIDSSLVICKLIPKLVTIDAKRLCEEIKPI